MGTLEITRGRQALELRSNLSERRALTDPIRPPGRDESSARNLQWAKAHGEGCSAATLCGAGTWGGAQAAPPAFLPPWRRQAAGTAMAAVGVPAPG